MQREWVWVVVAVRQDLLVGTATVLKRVGQHRQVLEPPLAGKGRLTTWPVRPPLPGRPQRWNFCSINARTAPTRNSNPSGLAFGSLAFPRHSTARSPRRSQPLSAVSGARSAGSPAAEPPQH